MSAFARPPAAVTKHRRKRLGIEQDRIRHSVHPRTRDLGLPGCLWLKRATFAGPHPARTPTRTTGRGSPRHYRQKTTLSHYQDKRKHPQKVDNERVTFVQWKRTENPVVPFCTPSFSLSFLIVFHTLRGDTGTSVKVLNIVALTKLLAEAD